MDQNNDKPRPSNKTGWIIGAVLVALLVIVAVQGLVRGGGEAAGVTQAAPGDDNAMPAPETARSDRQ